MIVGIDNGITGTVGVIEDDLCLFYETPITVMQDYTKAKKNISRLDARDFYTSFRTLKESAKKGIKVYIERPLVNPERFNATLSAVRLMEAQITVLESLQIPYEFVDSRKWQREMLPEGVKGTAELKKASMDIGMRHFPLHSELIRKHRDADGLLIAEYFSRKGADNAG